MKNYPKKRIGALIRPKLLLKSGPNLVHSVGKGRKVISVRKNHTLLFNFRHHKNIFYAKFFAKSVLPAYVLSWNAISVQNLIKTGEEIRRPNHVSCPIPCGCKFKFDFTRDWYCCGVKDEGWWVNVEKGFWREYIESAKNRQKFKVPRLYNNFELPPNAKKQTNVDASV